MWSRHPMEAARIVGMLGIFLCMCSSVSSQCAGSALVLTATGTYQVFTSPNYPFSYANNLNCVWRIEAANATDAIRLEVIETAIEYHGDCVYDNGEVFDGYNASASSMGRFCGTMEPNYVSTEQYMTVTFMSDYSLAGKGFKAQYKSGDRDSLLDKDDSSDDLSGILVVGVATGVVVFLLLIAGIIYTCIHAKKAKESRNRLRRGTSSTRVEPFMYDMDARHINGPPPPSYGDIYASPMSPPPQYAEVDPNPEGNTTALPILTDVLESDNVNGETIPTYADVAAGRTGDTNANTHFNGGPTAAVAGNGYQIRNPQPAVRAQPLNRSSIPVRSRAVRPGVPGQTNTSRPGVQGQNGAQGQTGTAQSSNQRTASRQSIGANIGAIRALRGMRLNSLNANSNNNTPGVLTGRPNNPTQRDNLPNSVRTPSVSGSTNPFGLVEPSDPTNLSTNQLNPQISDQEADALSQEINSPRYPPASRAPQGTTLAEVHRNAENQRRGSDVSEMSLPVSLSTISGSTVSVSSQV